MKHRGFKPEGLVKSPSSLFNNTTYWPGEEKVVPLV
jgi:hypothetical protein